MDQKSVRKNMYKSLPKEIKDMIMEFWPYCINTDIVDCNIKRFLFKGVIETFLMFKKLKNVIYKNEEGIIAYPKLLFSLIHKNDDPLLILRTTIDMVKQIGIPPHFSHMELCEPIIKYVGMCYCKGLCLEQSSETKILKINDKNAIGKDMCNYDGKNHVLCDRINMLPFYNLDMWIKNVTNDYCIMFYNIQTNNVYLFIGDKQYPYDIKIYKHDSKTKVTSDPRITCSDDDGALEHNNVIGGVCYSCCAYNRFRRVYCMCPSNSDIGQNDGRCYICGCMRHRRY